MSGKVILGSTFIVGAIYLIMRSKILDAGHQKQMTFSAAASQQATDKCSCDFLNGKEFKIIQHGTENGKEVSITKSAENTCDASFNPGSSVVTMLNFKQKAGICYADLASYGKARPGTADIDYFYYTPDNGDKLKIELTIFPDAKWIEK